MADASLMRSGLDAVVETVDVFAVRLPARAGLTISGGPVISAGRTADRVLVRASAGGVTGWGEATPTPRWTYETTESITTTIERYLAPALIGLPVWDLDGALHACERVIHPGLTVGAPLAKSALDMALHDLVGRLLGVSVGQLWGQRRVDDMPLAWVVSGTDPDEMAASVGDGAELGYAAFKVKVGLGRGVAHDLACVAAVRSVAPRADLWADANGAYRLDQARVLARGLERFDVLALEQPLAANDFHGHRDLRRLCGVPIALDETLREPRDLMTAVRLGSLDVVVAKVQRSGGLTRARRLCQLAEDCGLPVMGSGLTDSDIGMAASLHLFAAFGVTTPVDLNGRQFVESPYVGDRTVETHPGVAEVPSGPGLGVEVDVAAVRELSFEPFQDLRP